VAGGGTFPNNQTVYVLLTLTGDFGETTAGAIANVTTTALNNGVTVSLAKSYGPAATGVNIYEADVASGSAAPSTYHLVAGAPLRLRFTGYRDYCTGGAPPANNPSSTVVLPIAGGGFAGSMNTDANTLGDGTVLGEDNVLVTPHVITVVYSGDQNYLPSTSVATTVTVVDVSPTTPITLPLTPVGPAPYCTAPRRSRHRRPAILLLLRCGIQHQHHRFCQRAGYNCPDHQFPWRLDWSGRILLSRSA